MRQVIVAGNWKMNASKETVNTLIMGVLSGMAKVDSTVIVCAPFPYMSQVEALITHSQLHLGAQDLNVNASGAFTGEVSADMIKDFGAKYVVVGHSERRSMYGETDELVAQKVQAALDNQLTPLFCIGETLKEKKRHKTFSILKKQIIGSLEKSFNINKIIFAYEPIWSIGTNKVPKMNELKNTIKFIKNEFKKIFKRKKSPKVLYGGSVNGKNIRLFFSFVSFL